MFAVKKSVIDRFDCVRVRKAIQVMFTVRRPRAEKGPSFGLRKSISLCAATLVVFLASPSLFAQVNTGRILGTVSDQTGGVIAGAMVTVTNSQTGVARTLTADQAGEYVAPNLNPGTYTVRASSNGFQTFERQNITLGLGQDARVDAQLVPGQVTQTVEVTSAAPMLDTTSAVVSGTVTTETIVDLPLKARNYQDFLALRPGVMQTPGGGTLDHRSAWARSFTKQQLHRRTR